MEKLLSFYRGLTPQTRFRLIFFVLASLIWVPVRMNSGVEVYEPYRYDIDDVEENQVVFACRLTGISAYSRQDVIWVIRKDGTCRLKNLVVGTESAQNNYVPEKWTDDELLEHMDEYMQDEALAEMDEKLMLDRDTVNYCINLTEIKYKDYSEEITDGSQECKYYVVCGTGKDRHLKMLATEGNSIRVCGDLNVFHAYDRIGQICQMIY